MKKISNEMSNEMSNEISEDAKAILTIVIVIIYIIGLYILIPRTPDDQNVFFLIWVFLPGLIKYLFWSK